VVRLAGSPAEIADEFGDSRLIGGPLIFASSTAVLFGAYEQTSGAAFIVSLPASGRPATSAAGRARSPATRREAAALVE
jgi:hypothetical protein